MATKIIFIFGAGANIGSHVAKQFALEGYKVAVTSRSGKSTDPGYLKIKAVLGNPGTVKEIFAKVQSDFGAAPNIVVYDAFELTYLLDDPLALSQSQLEKANAVNITAPYLATQEAVRGFQLLPTEVPKTFIYTGNGMNSMVVPSFVGLGIGKSASANWIEGASITYGPKGFSFYYADERQADGSMAGQALSGDAAGEF